MSPVEVSRRRLLAGAGLLGAAVATGVVVAPRLTDDDAGGGADGPETPESPTAAIALVGAAYLSEAPEDEHDEARLRSLLPTLTAASANGLVDQLDTLAEPVRDDFAEDRTALVDGWILSVTEARAAALVHLAA